MSELATAERTRLAVHSLQERVDRLESARREPIAVIGIGCRYPGGIVDPTSFWRVLSQGVDAITEVDRWPPESRATRWAGFLDGVDLFEPEFFGLSESQATWLDPQQRLLLEVAWEAVESAGYRRDQLRGQRMGVFMGMSSQDYLQLLARSDVCDPEAALGTQPAQGSARIARFLEVTGPHITLDTACSSSLVALHQACRSLREGECDTALCGGVNLILSPSLWSNFAKTGALSAQGRCRTFDAGADGFIRSEGCGVVLLKPLSAALSDGDRVWAVVRGTAVCQDGRSNGLTVPNGLAQQNLLRLALGDARVGPEAIDYVETHGTATPVGDPIEWEALREVLGAPRADGSPCVLGSIKTNFGHAEAAAGIAGFLKVVLSLYHETIPPHLHFETLNPRMSLDGTCFAIPTQARSWRRGGRPRLGGVSSFGMSGTNAHAIIAEGPPMPRGDEEREGAVVFPISAADPEALREWAGRLADWLDEENWRDVARTLARHRTHHPFRQAVTGQSAAELQACLRQVTSVDKPAPRRLVFVFPGQGSQWLGMGRELLATQPVFRQQLQRCHEAILTESGWSLLEELQANELTSRIDVLQPMIFSLQMSLAALWRSWGVEPDVLVGHSMGEVAAAGVAGALSLEEAVAVICRRSRLLVRISGKGAMAVVELSMEQAQQRLRQRQDKLSVAVSNSPRSTVVAGDPESLAQLLAELEKEEIFWRHVKVDVASHSPQVEPLTQDLLTALAHLRPKAGSLPLFSTVHAQLTDGSGFDAAYWVDNLRQTVQFHAAVAHLSGSLFVEISPHPILLPSLENQTAVASLRRGQPELASLAEGLGLLYSQGVEVDWSRLYPDRRPPAQLPTYPFQRRRIWLEQARPRPTGHPLLGQLTRLSLQPGAWLWESRLSLPHLPPMEGPLLSEMVEAAASQAGLELAQRDIHVRHDLTLGAEEMTVQTVLSPTPAGSFEIAISSRQGQEWLLHAKGSLSALPGGG